MLNKTCYGTYLSSYFHIEIDTDIDLNEYLKNDQSTFVHEYIHFLQNFLLPYCVQNTKNEFNDFWNMSDYYLSQDKVIKPYNNNVSNNKFEALFGSNDIYEKDFYCDSLEENIKEEIKYYVMKINSGEKINIGAYHLLEYISYKIENKFYGTQLPPAPYLVIDKIFEYYGLKNILEDKKILICEYSLYFENPISALIESINKILKKSNISLEVDDILNFDNIYNDMRSKQLESLIAIFNEQYKHHQFETIRKWLNNIVNYVNKNIKTAYYFHSLYQLDAEDFVNKISILIENIGAPILINNKKHFYNLNNRKKYIDKDFIYMWALYNYKNYLRDSQLFCPMSAYCKEIDNNIFDEDCSFNPFIK